MSSRQTKLAGAAALIGIAALIGFGADVKPATAATPHVAVLQAALYGGFIPVGHHDNHDWRWHRDHDNNRGRQEDYHRFNDHHDNHGGDRNRGDSHDSNRNHDDHNGNSHHDDNN